MEAILARISLQLEALTIVLAQVGVQAGYQGELSKMEAEAEEADRARTYGESNTQLLYKKLGIEPIVSAEKEDKKPAGELGAK